MSELLSIIQSLDASMTSQLVANLAGLSIAAASFLLSTVSNHQTKKDLLTKRIFELETEEEPSQKKIEFIKEEKVNLAKAKKSLSNAKDTISDLYMSSIAFITCLVESLTIDHIDIAFIKSNSVYAPFMQTADVFLYGALMGVGITFLAKAVNNMQKIANA